MSAHSFRDLLPTYSSTCGHANGWKKILRVLGCAVALVLSGCSCVITTNLYMNFHVCSCASHGIWLGCGFTETGTGTNKTYHNRAAENGDIGQPLLHFFPIGNGTSTECITNETDGVLWFLGSGISCVVFFIARVYNMRGKGHGHLCKCPCKHCTSVIDVFVSKACPLMLAYTSTIDVDGDGFSTIFTIMELLFSGYLITTVVSFLCGFAVAKCLCLSVPKLNAFVAFKVVIASAVFLGAVSWLDGLIDKVNGVDSVVSKGDPTSNEAWHDLRALIAWNLIGGDDDSTLQLLFALMTVAGFLNFLLVCIETVLEIPCGVGKSIRGKIGIDESTWEDPELGHTTGMSVPMSEPFLQGSTCTDMER
eukprot:COSAG01_NODE_3942_length_5509_cov_11.737893_1_plen_364_part_00